MKKWQPWEKTDTWRPIWKQPRNWLPTGEIARAAKTKLPELRNMNPVDVARGNGPIVLGLPHTGTYVPEEIWHALNDNVARGWTIPIGILINSMTTCCLIVTSVRATFHRYVIDANRDPSGAKSLSRPEHHRADAR